jgi:hypothetical protein
VKLGEAALRQAVSMAGATYVGLQARARGGALLLFNGEDGSTRSVDIADVLAAAVKAKLQPAGPDRLVELAVRAVAELHRLGSAVETIAKKEGGPA